MLTSRVGGSSLPDRLLTGRGRLMICDVRLADFTGKGGVLSWVPSLGGDRVSVTGDSADLGGVGSSSTSSKLVPESFENRV